LPPGLRTHSGHDHISNMTLGFLGFRLIDQELSQRMSRQKVRKLTRSLLQYWTTA